MKYKQDYKIIVQADMEGIPFFTMEHKGATRIADDEDLAVVSGMLGEIKDSIDRHLNKQKGE